MIITNIIVEQQCTTDHYTQLTITGVWCMLSHYVPDQNSQYIKIRSGEQAGLRGKTMRPIHCRGKTTFRYSHASMLKWSATPTCMNHMLWKTSSSSTGWQVLPRTQALEENHGQCHTRLMENLYRWLRFLVTLSLVKGPSSVHSTMLGNQSSSIRHCKHKCLNSCWAHCVTFLPMIWVKLPDSVCWVRVHQ